MNHFTTSPRPSGPAQALLPALMIAAALGDACGGTLEFNRDIRPILSENCFHCHGQDPKHREADLRLDEREGALRDLGGYAAIVPGKPEVSEIVKRMESRDPDDLMPPKKSNRQVSAEQIALVRRWIAEGATYQQHWAYIPPQKANPPAVNGARHAIDAFVRERLAKEGLSPSPEAKPETWLRRASLDLRGLPPKAEEVSTFLEDVKARGETAYSAAADRLLSSPSFGERMAIDWLDVARYADTHGFNNDSMRHMWRWRDWVIDAFNTNMPYDRFITEQLAGDLLPNATSDQQLATGFARNHVINSEGGIIDEEYRVEYVADRVRTMSTAWLGLTFECARCHDHKFDAITQRDYYRLFAFFNNVPEAGESGRVDNAGPLAPTPTREQKAVIARQAEEIATQDAQLRDGPKWSADKRPQIDSLAAAAKAEVAKLDGKRVIENDTGPAGVVGNCLRADPKNAASKSKVSLAGNFTLAFWIKPDGGNAPDVPLFSAINYEGNPAGANYGAGRDIRLVNGEIEFRAAKHFPSYVATVRTLAARIVPGEWRHIVITSAGFKAKNTRMLVDGAEVATITIEDGLDAAPGGRETLIGADNSKNTARFHGELDEALFFAKPLSTAQVAAVFAADALPFAQAQASPTERQRAWLDDALQSSGVPAIASKRLELRDKHFAFLRELPSTMVMQELPEKRPSFLLKRGQYDAPGERVEPGVPEKLMSPWPAGAPTNRLGLAQWLTQSSHPLTARVVVNRFWAQLFGNGLVKTVEDFGSQSEWPSHPELLDWLARDFVESGWNVKALFKSMVLSATYRQSSTASPTLMARDPENRLLARGPRVRLPAEIIRDQALAISGLLSTKVGGPSVYPYQPAKLYDGVVVGADYPGTKWNESKGEDLYRRSLYTFWKRTITHPAMITFDAPDREFCTARRSRTNTPLQALVLWNETGYVEAARNLGARMLREGGSDDSTKVAFVFRLATCRLPNPQETRVLSEALTRLRDDFRAHPEDASAFLKVGASPIPSGMQPAELAAAAGVASMILNLDETITKN